MRTWTLAVSILAHAAIVAAVFVAPSLAAADLPDPHRPLTFESVIAIEMPTVPVTPAPRPAQASSAASSTLVAGPADVPPDAPPIEMPPDLPAACDSCGIVGIPIGGGRLDHVVAAPPPPPGMPPTDPVRVGGVVRPPTRVVYVAPVYPQMALSSRVEGTVILQAVIDEKGSVRALSVLRGHPLLDQAAMQAVAKWQFTPTLLNGTAVPVVMTVTVSFRLQK